jgi:hypothetical protein
MDQIASIVSLNVVNLPIIVLTCGGINVEHGGLMCANLFLHGLPFTNCQEIWGCPDQNPLTFKKGGSNIRFFRDFTRKSIRLSSMLQPALGADDILECTMT